MPQTAHTSGQGTSSTPADDSSLVCLLEELVQDYREMGRYVLDFRQCCIRRDLEGMLRAVQSQTFSCDRLQNGENRIRSILSASPSVAGRGQELLAEIASLKACVYGMNRVNARMLEKAARNNTILQNVFANALVYSDPRASVALRR